MILVLNLKLPHNMKPKERNKFYDMGKITKRPPRNTGEPSKLKVKGFGFYLQCNNKLSKKNRKKFQEDSVRHLGDVMEYFKKSSGDGLVRLDITEELDFYLTDEEIVSEWNSIYDRYGGMMSEFSHIWEKEFCNDKKVTENPHLIITLINRIDYFERRIKKLEENERF